MKSQDKVLTSDPVRYTEIKTALLMGMPFFASLLLDLMNVKIGKFPSMGLTTAGTDGKTIWIDEDFMKKLTLPECLFLVAHEILHAILLHMPRAKRYKDIGFDGQPFNDLVWNIATDYAVNATLVESKVGVMPKGGLLDMGRFPHTQSADENYRELMKNPPPPKPRGKGKGPPGGGPPGDGSGGSEPTPGEAQAEQGTLDAHVMPASADVNEHEVRRAVESASAAAKAQGKMPAGLSRLVDGLLNPQVSWQEKLPMQIMQSARRDTVNWSRPHKRRLLMQGVYLPAYTGHGIGDVVMVVDTSGSIGPRELKVFLSEVEGVLSTCNPERIWVVGADARVASVHELSGCESLLDNMPEVKGGGGTAFGPAFEWVQEEGIEPAVLIYLTDMYGSFPDVAPPYPVIWCSTTPDRTGPFGQTIHIDMEAA